MQQPMTDDESSVTASNNKTLRLRQCTNSVRDGQLTAAWWNGEAVIAGAF